MCKINTKILKGKGNKNIMKKIVTTLGLGLVIGAMGMNDFANDKENNQDKIIILGNFDKQA